MAEVTSQRAGGSLLHDALALPPINQSLLEAGNSAILYIG